MGWNHQLRKLHPGKNNMFTPWKITPQEIDIEPEHGELEDGSSLRV